MKPKYIGDGVYVEYDGFYIVLKAGDSLHPDDIIYLEDNVARELINYIYETFGWGDEDNG